jgi:hypothetical protein
MILKSWKKLSKFMFLLILFLPISSYCQYPKQTVINNDTVVIMLLEQANEMNQTFLRQNVLIDSLVYRVDTVESLYVKRNFVVLNDSVLLSNYKREVEYQKKKNKIINRVFDSVILSILFIGFGLFIITVEA